MEMRRKAWALVCACGLFAGACDDRGPPVDIADDPVGFGVLGVGGAGEEGMAQPAGRRPLNWARGPDGEIHGKVIVMGFSALVIDDPQGNRHRLQISPGTVVRHRGQPSSALVLEPGAVVEARYLTWRGQQVVAELDVTGQP